MAITVRDISLRGEQPDGVAAVVAVFHDTIITIGLFSLFNKEISLTVVAALLTLVGYSMNDTIVVFDRIRENLKLMRREKFENLINISINQTLSRTILTSGLTFLTAVALWLFGGPVLNGFAFALGGRYYHWNVLVDLHRESDPGVLAELIGIAQASGAGSVPALKETAAKKAVRTR